MAGCKYDSNVDNDNNSYLVGIGFVFRAILGRCAGRCAARHAGSLRSPVVIIHYTPIYLYIIYVYVYNEIPIFYITVYQ
jgi:hypothetical protein